MKTFLESLIQSDIEQVRYYLTQGIDVNQPCGNDEPPLHAAISEFAPKNFNYHDRESTNTCEMKLTILEVVDLLMITGANINIRNRKNQTLLHRLSAVTTSKRNRWTVLFFNQYNEIQVEIAAKLMALILTKNPELELMDDEGNTPLLVALTQGNENAALTLLSAGADPHTRNKASESTLRIACLKELKGVVPELLKSFNAIDVDLLDKCYDFDIKLMLLKGGAVLSLPERLILLQHAEQARHQELIDYLIDDVLIHACDEQGFTPLHHAKTLPLIQKLVMAGADIHRRTKSECLTPLLSLLKNRFCYIQNNDQEWVECCQFMINHQADLNACDSSGNSVMHYAAQVRFASAALFQCLSINSRCLNAKNSFGETPLHIAVMHNVTNAIFLLDLDADPNGLNDEGQTALEKIKFQRGHYFQDNILCIINRLLSLYLPEKLPTNAQDLLRIALTHNNFELAEGLQQRGLDVTTITDFNPLIAVLCSFAEDTSKLVYWLLNQNVDVDTLEQKVLMTPLQTIFSQSHDVELINHLLLKSSNPRQLTVTGKTLFHCLAQNPKLNRVITQDAENFPKLLTIVSLLVQKGIDSEQQDNEQKTALDYCFLRDDFPFMILALLSVRPLLVTEPKYIEQSLSFALRSNIPSIVKVILNASAGSTQEKMMETCLNHALTTDNKKLVALVMTCMKDKSKHYLHYVAKYAIAAGDMELLDQLFDNGLSTDAQITLWEHQLTLLQYAYHIAIESANNRKEPQKPIELINDLICCGCDLQFVEVKKYAYGFSDKLDSCLHVAARYNWVTTVKALLKRKVPIDSLSHQATALTIAVEQGSIELTRLLLEEGANIYIKMPKGDSLLHCACSQGHVEITDLLLTHGHSPNREIEENNLFHPKPINAVVFANYSTEIKEKLVRLLIAAGAHMDNWLITEAIKRHVNATLIIELLQNISPLIVQKTCFLHQAIEADHLEVTHWLIEHYGAILFDERDGFGRTVFHIATSPGRENIFERLSQLSPFVDSCDDAGYTCAHYSLFYGTFERLALPVVDNIELLAFRKLHYYIQDQRELRSVSDNSRLFMSGDYSYKLITLFGKADVAIAFIQRHLTKDLSPITRTIHDLCLFSLPRQGHWHQEIWAGLALNYASELTSYLHFAPKIEELLGRPPSSLDEIKKVAAQIKYARFNENPPLAKLFIRHKITEAGFNHVLDYYTPKESDFLPNLYIEGTDLEDSRCHNYYLKKLGPYDPRGFILGALTHCCQSVGGAGQKCAMHGMTSLNGGFYVVFKKTKPKDIEKAHKLYEKAETATDFKSFVFSLNDREQRKKWRLWKEENNFNDSEALIELRQLLKTNFDESVEGELIAQMWAWLSESGALVFDSWEPLRPENNTLCEPFIRRAAEIVQTEFNINEVLLGKSGRTPENLSFTLATKSHQPKDYIAYRDSIEQLIVLTTMPIAEDKDNAVYTTSPTLA